MSCLLGFSVRPLTIRPFSSNAVSFVTLLAGECSSSTFLAITTPLAFRHGPVPMRSRALTNFGSFNEGAWVLRYGTPFLVVVYC